MADNLGIRVVLPLAALLGLLAACSGEGGLGATADALVPPGVTEIARTEGECAAPQRGEQCAEVHFRLDGASIVDREAAVAERAESEGFTLRERRPETRYGGVQLEYEREGLIATYYLTGDEVYTRPVCREAVREGYGVCIDLLVVAERSETAGEVPEVSNDPRSR